MELAAIIVNALKKKSHMYLHVVKLLEDAYANRGYETMVLWLEEGMANQQLNALTEERKPKILCSLDMAGFEASTLAETFYYNICTAKQMHLVLHEKCWRTYQGGEFALNLYLFLPGDTDRWRKAFPDVPNLYGYEALAENDGDRERLESVVETFLQDIAC